MDAAAALLCHHQTPSQRCLPLEVALTPTRPPPRMRLPNDAAAPGFTPVPPLQSWLQPLSP